MPASNQLRISLLLASLPLVAGTADSEPAWITPPAPAPGGAFTSEAESAAVAGEDPEIPVWPRRDGRPTPPPGGEFPARLWLGSPGLNFSVQTNYLYRSWAETAIPAPPKKKDRK